MSTWRHLMTPLYEKFYTQEEQTPNLSTSKSNYQLSLQASNSIHGISSSRKNLKKSSLLNERISDLKNEMTKLKIDLIKKPKRVQISNVTTVKKDIQVNHNEDNNSKVDLHDDHDISNHQEKYANLESYSKTDRYSLNNDDDYDGNEDDDDDVYQTKKNVNDQNFLYKLDKEYNHDPYNNLKRELKTALKKPKQQQTYQNEKDIFVIDTFRGNRKKPCEENNAMSLNQCYDSISHNTIKNNLEGKLHNSPGKKQIINKLRNDNSSISIIDTNDLKYLSGQNNHKHNDIKDDSESIKMILQGCKDEIDELKSIVMQSKNQIDVLQKELDMEKKKSKNLRSTILKLSFKSDKFDESMKESNGEDSCNEDKKLKNKKLTNQLTKITGLEKKPKEIPKKIKINELIEVDEEIPKLHTARNISYDNEDIFINFLDAHKPRSVAMISYKDDKLDNMQNNNHQVLNMSKEGVLPSRVSQKEMSIQCDLMLDKLAEIDNEKEIKDLNEEIVKKNDEIRKLKGEKNSMIEVLENIVKVLNKTKNTNQKQEKKDNINKTFKEFHEYFKQKMDDIKKIKQDISLPERKILSTNERLNNSKVGKMEDATENLIYSISNNDASIQKHQLNKKEKKEKNPNGNNNLC